MTPNKLKRLKDAFGRQDWRCTMFPNGLWKRCCIRHDHACALAHVKMNKRLRKQADIDLRNCANKIFPLVGEIMYIGVRGFNFWKKIRGKSEY